jgi:hypothetical protein
LGHYNEEKGRRGWWDQRSDKGLAAYSRQGHIFLYGTDLKRLFENWQNQPSVKTQVMAYYFGSG